MKLRAFLVASSAFSGLMALCPASAFAALPTCSQLATNPAYGLAGNAAITQTSSDNEGIPSPTAVIIPATATTSAYCWINLQYSSESGPTYGYAQGESQTIGIGIGLPLNSTDGGTPINPSGYGWVAVNGAWNGKVENLGGGGTLGTIGSPTQATNAGYVGSSTDGGHNSAQNGTTGGNWGVIQATHQLDVGKINDFEVESEHQQYLWALKLASAYYGQAATRNYWNGCSTGGRQSMALAGAYGYDFDGILGGAPTVYENSLDLSHKWPAVVNRDDVVGAGDTAITTAQYAAAVANAIAACDVEGTDVVKDGVVDDPRQCTYKVSKDTTLLAAPAGTCTGANCFDSIQAAAMDKIWYGPRDHLGRRLWHPWWPVDTGGMIALGPTITTTSKDTYYDHADLTYDVQNLYSSRLMAETNPFGEPVPISFEDEMGLNYAGPEPLLASANYQGIINNIYNGPKHGKIIMWQGWADPLVPPQDGLQYYRYVATQFGGATGSNYFGGLWSWFRYYHAPGVGHCGGGVGADPTATKTPDGQGQLFDDLVNWVENGVVPQSAGDSTHDGILATGPGTFGTRPICPFPTTAIYSGTGSTAVASNYYCGGNLDASPATPATNNVTTTCQGLVANPANNNGGLDYNEQGVTPAQCPAPVQVSTHDFNGDSGSDVLWRDTSGNVGLWLMNGTTVLQSQVLGNVPTNWSVIGQRDFTGSGNADLLWRDTSGNVGIWVMNGANIVSSSILGNVPTTWSAVGTGDFNTNGSGAILWRDNSGNLAIWFMSATSTQVTSLGTAPVTSGVQLSQTAYLGNVPVNWIVAGVDSSGDIVWRNTTTGDVAMWTLNGTTVTQAVDLGAVPLTWTIAGVGDFDGNGSTDIVWRDTSGNVGIWLMNGTQILSTKVLGNVPTNWSIAATGDYNGDGKSDIMWTDTSGNVGVWFMNGTTVSSTTLYGKVGTAWTVQAVNAD